MSALTAVEAGKLSGEANVVKRMAIVKTFEDNSPLLRHLPILNIAGDTYRYSTEANLPGVGFRGYNEGFQTTTGIVNENVEVLKMLGAQIDTDRRLAEVHGPEVHTMREQQAARAMALAVNSYIINGDSRTEPRSFDGLRARIVGNQLIPANLSSPSTSGPLSLEALMKAIDEVRNPTAIVMSKEMYRKVSKAAHQNLGGEITVDIDQFGYRTPYFEGLPILTVDYDHRGQKVIDFNETGPDGNTQTQSIYVISGSTDGVTLLQNDGIRIYSLGELPDKPTIRTRLEWMLSLAVLHGRAAARVWGITNADVTA